VGKLDVVTAELPTSFTRGIRKLRALIGREQPDIVLCVGLAADRAAINVERVAVNLCHARIADNDGLQPVDQPILARGPAAYFSTLPVVNIMKALERAGLRAQMSMSAGTYVCNHLFYELMHVAKKNKHVIRAGFVHVPALPVADAECALANLVRALEIVLRITQRSAKAATRKAADA